MRNPVLLGLVTCAVGVGIGFRLANHELTASPGPAWNPPSITGSDVPVTLAGYSTTAEENAPAAATLEAQLSHPVVLGDTPTEMYCSLTLRGGALASTSTRPPMNLALVIDRSGSMGQEDKLECAKRAAADLIDRLQPEDRFTLVAYDDKIQVVQPPTTLADRDSISSAISALEPGGATNLFGGLATGFEQLEPFLDQARLHRIILISDGLANRGVTDPDSIAQKISGWRDRGVRVTTLGVGIDYDEVLLSNVSEYGSGHYYYVPDANGLDQTLQRELEELGRSVARDIRVVIDLAPGVELLDLYGHAFEHVGEQIVVRPRDLSDSERRRIVLRLKIPATSSPHAVVTATQLHYVDAATGDQRAVRAGTLQATPTHDPKLVERCLDLAVLEKAEVIHNALALEAATDLMRQGQHDLAANQLRDRARRSSAVNTLRFQSATLTKQIAAMESAADRALETAGDHAASRDLQIVEQLRALGYVGN